MPTARPPAKTPPPTTTSQRLRVTRDGAIVTVTLVLTTYEITLGGARPWVLTFLSGLILSPVAIRYDESKRKHR